jgi:hypothetical protein
MRSEERLSLVAEGKGMLLSLAILSDMREAGEIMSWPSENLYGIDVTYQSTQAVASEIILWVKSVTGTAAMPDLYQEGNSASHMLD